MVESSENHYYLLLQRSFKGSQSKVKATTKLRIMSESLRSRKEYYVPCCDVG